jgi:hypothetical protein
MESINQDRIYRQKAFDLWKKIIKTPKEKWYKYSNASGNELEIKDIDGEYSDLILQIFPSKNPKKWYQAVAEKDVDNLEDETTTIKIFLPNKPDLIRQVQKDNKDGWIEESFIHEFIHYLDLKRFKNKKTLHAALGTEKIFKREGIFKYVNHPLELNAYYQQAVSNYEDIFYYTLELYNKDKEQDFYETYLETFDSFMKDFKKYTSGTFKEFFENLTPKNQQKIKKRLYGLYMNLKKELEDKLKRK